MTRANCPKIRIDCLAGFTFASPAEEHMGRRRKEEIRGTSSHSAKEKVRESGLEIGIRHKVDKTTCVWEKQSMWNQPEWWNGNPSFYYLH